MSGLKWCLLTATVSCSLPFLRGVPRGLLWADRRGTPCDSGAMERPKREKVLTAADLKRKAELEELKAAREGKKSRLESMEVRGR